MNVIKVLSPRIHNLGDFLHCLPTISAISKHYDAKISFGIGVDLKVFKNLKELLLFQVFFFDVHFIDEPSQVPSENYILVDDHGADSEDNNELAYADYRNVNFVNKHYNLNLELDPNFELIVPRLDIDYRENKTIVGDRWGPENQEKFDFRREYNVLKKSGKFDSDEYEFLDFSKDLVYNCSLIKYNPNKFYTTFAGVSVLADLMKKETVVLWGDDMKTWQGQTVEQTFNLHHARNRNTTLKYLGDL
jgi:hypothetical protein